MTEALVVHEHHPMALERPSPKEIIQQATEEANALAGVIEKQHLYSMIQGKKFVKVEGWQTLACLRGCLPREVSMEEFPDGRYVATMELVRMSDGAVLSRASAECGGPEDYTWQSRPPNARRSMAATRGSGKVCRIAFAWVMAMSGFETTPAEEMPDEDRAAPRPAPAPKQSTKPIDLPATPPGTLRKVGYIKSYNVKSDRKGNPRCSFMVGDNSGDSPWLSTYHETLTVLAKQLSDGGDLVDAWYKQEGNFFVLDDISAAVMGP